jgi:hypothetical protein
MMPPRRTAVKGGEGKVKALFDPNSLTLAASEGVKGKLLTFLYKNRRSYRCSYKRLPRLPFTPSFVGFFNYLERILPSPTIHRSFTPVG